MVARQIFVKNSCTEINENPKHGLVVYTRWRADGHGPDTVKGFLKKKKTGQNETDPNQ